MTDVQLTDVLATSSYGDAPSNPDLIWSLSVKSLRRRRASASSSNSQVAPDQVLGASATGAKNLDQMRRLKARLSGAIAMAALAEAKEEEERLAALIVEDMLNPGKIKLVGLNRLSRQAGLPCPGEQQPSRAHRIYGAVARWVVEPYLLLSVIMALLGVDPWRTVVIGQSAQGHYMFLFFLANCAGTAAIAMNRQMLVSYWHHERGRHLQDALRDLCEDAERWELCQRRTRQHSWLAVAFGGLLTLQGEASSLDVIATHLEAPGLGLRICALLQMLMWPVFAMSLRQMLDPVRAKFLH